MWPPLLRLSFAPASLPLPPRTAPPWAFPTQVGCAGLAYPCLILTYVGQGAYLISNPQDVGDTFWKSCPKCVRFCLWARV